MFALLINIEEGVDFKQKAAKKRKEIRAKRERGMKKLSAVLVVLFGLLICVQAADIPNKVDWKCFMAQHDLIWDEMPLRWENGSFGGNGYTGSTIFVNPNLQEIKVLVSRSDIGTLGIRMV